MNKAFLKWAGGKTQSLQMISEAAGFFTGRFIEPFVGSAVVSLNVSAESYILGDYNKDLINVYNFLKEDVSFIEDLKVYFVVENNDVDMFYKLRARFNEASSLKERALLFIYLNRHCFNGLCRFNKSGGFNVPFGKYKSIYFPEKELINAKNLLNKSEIYYQSFEDTFKLAKNDDAVYCDPPYVPLSETASFTDYSVGGFSEEQQVQLAKLAEEAPCRVLISNHDTEFTRDIYSKANEIRTRKVSRFISAKASSRKPVYELLAIYNKEN
jgi:DNA adenine methylase